MPNNTKSDIYFLNIAIKEAWRYQLLTYPNPAVGCVIVQDGKILSKYAHKKAGMLHAELGASRELFLNQYPNSPLKNINDPFEVEGYIEKNHNNIFKNTTFYVTLEPCSHIGKTPSCAIFLSKIKPKKVVVGTKDINKIASGGVEVLKKNNIVVDILNNKVSKELLYPFAKYNYAKFIFFKMAIRTDGSNNGTISSEDSFKFIHEIRSLLDLLIIGGNSVRIDRPILDARKVNKKAPNILIYSKKRNFDKNIKLFNVQNRKVTIDDKLDLGNDKFIMVEGGYNLYDNLKNKIDMLLLIVSHKDRLKKIDIEKKFDKKIIYSYFINDVDEIVFLK